MTKQVTLVEDDEAVRESLCAILESWDYQVHDFEDGESLLEAGFPCGTNSILLDVRLPGIDGISLLSKIRETDKTTPIMILTGHGDISMAVTALKNGAQDFIEKPYDDEDLVRRIENVDAIVSNVAADRQKFVAVLSALTPRETDVMREVVAGFANKMIAHRLNLSPKTVEIHRARVMEKTGAKSLSHLVRIALKAGIDPDLDAP